MDLLYKTIEESEWVNQGTYREKKFTFNGIEYRAEWFAGGVSLYADGEDTDYYKVPFSDADEGVEYLTKQDQLERMKPVQQAVYSPTWKINENGTNYKDVTYKGKEFKFFYTYGSTRVPFIDQNGFSSLEMRFTDSPETCIIRYLVSLYGE